MYQVINKLTGEVRLLNGTDLLLDDCPNFTVKEFASKDGNEIVVFNPNILRVAQSIRYTVEMPITLNSAFRSLSHNQAVGGHPNSRHMEGDAIDIATPSSMTSEDFLTKILLTVGNEYGFGLYDTFIHIDDRGYSKFWDNRTK